MSCRSDYVDWRDARGKIDQIVRKTSCRVYRKTSRIIGLRHVGRLVESQVRESVKRGTRNGD